MDGTRITICPAHGMFTNLATGPPVTWAYVTESGSRLEYMFEEGTSYWSLFAKEFKTVYKRYEAFALNKADPTLNLDILITHDMEGNMVPVIENQHKAQNGCPSPGWSALTYLSTNGITSHQTCLKWWTTQRPASEHPGQPSIWSLFDQHPWNQHGHMSCITNLQLGNDKDDEDLLPPLCNIRLQDQSPPMMYVFPQGTRFMDHWIQSMIGITQAIDVASRTFNDKHLERLVDLFHHKLGIDRLPYNVQSALFIINFRGQSM